jgi:hypothetical protein
MLFADFTRNAGLFRNRFSPYINPAKPLRALAPEGMSIQTDSLPNAVTTESAGETFRSSRIQVRLLVPARKINNLIILFVW